MIGFLNLNKPKGLTSHDCVARVRRLLKIKRVGHGGTLDPAASGVLPIAVGKATRLLNYLPTKKAYRAVIRFGVTTSTDDLEGEIIATKSAAGLTLAEIEAQLHNFIGTIEQIPPIYSAIQVDGKRLYKLAREGKQVDVPSRQVEIEKIDVLNWYPGEFPELELEITCGGGTYIRAIARDLGNCVNTGGTLASLTRTLSCGFELASSISLESLADDLQGDSFSLITLKVGLSHLNNKIIPQDLAKRWCQGQRIYVVQKKEERRGKKEEVFVRVEGENGICLGIGELFADEDGWLLVPKVVIA